jgi:hypothetical protein
LIEDEGDDIDQNAELWKSHLFWAVEYHFQRDKLQAERINSLASEAEAIVMLRGFAHAGCVAMLDQELLDVSSVEISYYHTDFSDDLLAERHKGKVDSEKFMAYATLQAHFMEFLRHPPIDILRKILLTASMIISPERTVGRYLRPIAKKAVIEEVPDVAKIAGII